MIEDIKRLKEKILQYTDQEVSKYGNNRMDTKVVGELADVIKDLAEAEYYCSVAQAMGESEASGYGSMGGRSGYGGQGGSMGGNRSGYGGNMMGHSDPMSAIRDIMNTADPETKMMLRNEINKMM
jgi:hypothetical protein